MSVLPGLESAARFRWLLLGSLVLNLFFVGAAGAVAYRYSSPVPLANVARIDHTLASRFGRIAASLPSADAKIMRAELVAESEKVAIAQADLSLSQEEVRDYLRAEPFDADAVRKAMADNRVARENFEEILHDMIASAATKMSVVGRNKLAEWPAAHENARTLR